MGFIDQIHSIYNLKFRINEPMKRHTTIGVGGNALFYVEPYSLKALRDVIEIANDYHFNYKVLGKGSNVLFSDKVYKGIIISLKGLNNIYFKRDKIVTLGGVSLNKLITFSNDNGMFGLEGLIGIPATVGGAIVQNAGAFGYTISDYLIYTSVLRDGKICNIERDDCNFAYRNSIFKNTKDIVVYGVFKFPKCDVEKARRIVEEFRSVRAVSQPKNKSCGSIFKNPKGLYAGSLIENAGLKGFKLNRTKISNIHSNFLDIEEGCTAQEIYNLVQFVRDRVFQKYGVMLENEMEFIGDF